MWRRIGLGALGLAALVAVAIVIATNWHRWPDAAITSNHSSEAEHDRHDHADHGPDQHADLSLQAQKNLGLVSKPVRPSTYWRKIEVPGMIADQPGISDRGVVSPVTGTIVKIFHHPGDTVAPSTPLFTIRLASESLHTSQLELFKASREIEIARDQRKRLETASQSGALPQSRLLEIDNQIRRLQVNDEAYRQDLVARGLSADQIDAVTEGEFVTQMVVKSPEGPAMPAAAAQPVSTNAQPEEQTPFSFEMHDLKVELGQQVEAGQLLCSLADHRHLQIVGQAFKPDLPLIHEAANSGWDVELEFEVAESKGWPPLPKSLPITHVANVSDMQERTISFFLPLDNQWRSFERRGESRLLWRFRPGDRVRLHVPIEQLENVFVLPREALVREGPEAYVFHHKKTLFYRKPVHLLFEDRRHVVIANDGSLKPGLLVAQNSAAVIARVYKSQASGGEPSGIHVHADGSIHDPNAR